MEGVPDIICAVLGQLHLKTEVHQEKFILLLLSYHRHMYKTLRFTRSHLLTEYDMVEAATIAMCVHRSALHIRWLAKAIQTANRGPTVSGVGDLFVVADSSPDFAN